MSVIKHISPLNRAALLCGALLMQAPLQHAFAADTVRPEVGNPVKAAQTLLQGQKYRDALAKIKEADAVSGKTPYESYIVERVRGAAALGAGDAATAAASFDAVAGTGRLAASDQLKLEESIAGAYYRANDFPHAAQWASRYLKEGGTDGQMRTLMVQSYYMSNDCASVAREVQGSGDKLASEDQLQLLGACFQKQNNNAGYADVLMKLLANYPKKEYWVGVIGRIQRKPGFADRLGLDVARLKIATGTLDTANDYAEAAQLALQAGASGEAKKIVDEGFTRNLLGTGTDAERHQRLRNLVTKQIGDDQKSLPQSETQAASASDNGAGLLAVGYAYVSNGDFPKGIGLMEQGLKKGGGRRPEDAKLHLGIAYLLASQKTKAVQMFKTVNGNDGVTDLAHLWIIAANRS